MVRIGDPPLTRAKKIAPVLFPEPGRLLFEFPTESKTH
jgi:hypothetical protein